MRVRSGHGLWSEWVESAFSVSFPAPPVPSAHVARDDTMGAAQVSVFNPDPGTLQVLQVLIDADTGRPYAVEE